jgi:nucleotide-binding universal stress UspA family protein
MRILVPLDGTPESETAIPVARRLASVDDSAIYVLRVVEVMDGFSPLRFDPDIVAMMEEAGTYVGELVFDHALPTDRTLGLVEWGDDAGEQIISMARRHEIDLIVMTSRRKGWLRRLTRGSVYRQVAESQVCPVLGVPVSERKPAPVLSS